MPLSAGARLGPFEVSSDALASGGMGEVYRPSTWVEPSGRPQGLCPTTPPGGGEASSVSSERRGRLRRWIIPISARSTTSAGREPPFIAMELLEGETLQERLTRGPVETPGRSVIDLAVIDALDAAHLGRHPSSRHQAGEYLPYRPRPEDSGLRSREGIGRRFRRWGPAARDRAALTAPGDTVGTAVLHVAGTVRAVPLDARTDLFSLGLVLDEMATGRPAISRREPLDSLSSTPFSIALLFLLRR